MPTVLIVPEMMREVPAPYVDILKAAGFEVAYPKNPMVARNLCSVEEAIENFAVADAALASSERYSEEVLSALPKLRVIARSGVGYDGVDVPAATARNIAVTITPTANHEAVAELTLALMFAAAKEIVSYDTRVRGGDWSRQPPLAIRGKTLGIFGLGRIGSSLAFRAETLGMKVLATEKFPNTEFVRAQKIKLVGFDELLERSDYLSVHAPLTAETRGLFDKRAFAKMKPGSVFLNTARGPLMVEADLLEALQSGHLRAAGLDVFEQEPPSPENPLFQLNNVVLTPHIAGLDETSIVAMGVEAANSIVSLYRGNWPDGVVNDELRGRFQWQRT
jgi:phosphoglycerate dehydrogenase-like enzyme